MEPGLARTTFTAIDVTEVSIQWHAGRSRRRIAASFGLDRKTVRYADVGITHLMPQ